MSKIIGGKIGWKYAIGEIILIFIGITMAIWFNNWNESKKARTVEIKSLKEIQAAIRLDLDDIAINIEGFSKRTELYALLIEHFEKDLPPTKELKELFPYFLGMTTFLSNIGPYETLKSRGIAIITNDSIRNKVSRYYDLEYEKIQTDEKLHHDHYKNYLKPLLMQHFDLSTPLIQPLNYEALVKDRSFQQSVYWAFRTDRFMLNIYKRMDDRGKELLADIEVELKQLEGI